ncbi:MotA/TolQ/ExbB proton channel family protein [Leptolyngbya sp. FACHB-261]|uniref:MotA/TolQ/ExbB proton channel family protein n=1 Tax=Leptolyngbya sp. FACHB-261 TaxID=2692806 RepID=UPI001684D17C|nr:MotA/TolQ/ExbB proton channel family protein [Leptolyngbya sp. FACHB-261]MBD2103414.1 MotA/TolQ/ExbB proton channel family protein [Leptolyngbya sp. FACHB-261]
MARLFDLFVLGGPVMWPLLGLSVATLACALERAWFWLQLLRQEDRVAHEVLAAARSDLSKAAILAEQAQSQPIGRFLLAPLTLKQPTPETFRLALEAAGDREFVKMRQGDKLLETVVALAPLLGLLGTVTGLIQTFMNLELGDVASTNAQSATQGIGEALITTAMGTIVAIVALVFFRVFVTLQARQVEYFSGIGSDLELIYRQVWPEISGTNDAASVTSLPEPQLP